MFLDLTSMLKYDYNNFDYPYFHSLKRLTEDDYDVDIYMTETELIETGMPKLIELGKKLIPIKLFNDIVLMGISIGENSFKELRGGWSENYYTSIFLDNILKKYNDFTDLANYIRLFIVLYEYPDSDKSSNMSSYSYSYDNPFDVSAFPYSYLHDKIENLDDVLFVNSKSDIPNIENRKEIKCRTIDILKYYLYNMDNYHIPLENEDESLLVEIIKKVLDSISQEETGPDMINRLVSTETGVSCISYILCVKRDLREYMTLPYRSTGGYLDEDLYDPNSEGMASFEEVRNWYN